MDRVKLSIPYSFLKTRVHLDWQDIAFGLRNELITKDAAIEHAIQQVVEYAAPGETLIDLAGSNRNDPVQPLVEELAKLEPGQDADGPKAKWLFAVLAWLYDNASMVTDPLRAVEEVYADFDYPVELERFVRYMPFVPEQATETPSPETLMNRWKHYLEEASARFR